jgi:L-lactate dehydrogenase (cytochrome)
MRVIACVEDLRLLARWRVPRMFYDYVDSGSWTESTYRANEADLAAICFRQRVGVNINNRSLRSTMIGEDVAMPVALAPAGLCGMQHADGEILAARAAEAFGVPFCLSTMSICSIEDVAANTIKTVLVSALCDAQQGLYRAAHRPRERGAMLGARCDARSSARRPAAQGLA